MRPLRHYYWNITYYYERSIIIYITPEWLLLLGLLLLLLSASFPWNLLWYYRARLLSYYSNIIILFLSRYYGMSGLLLHIDWTFTYYYYRFITVERMDFMMQNFWALLAWSGWRLLLFAGHTDVVLRRHRSLLLSIRHYWNPPLFVIILLLFGRGADITRKISLAAIIISGRRTLQLIPTILQVDYYYFWSLLLLMRKPLLLYI